MEESYQNIRGGPLMLGGKEVKRSSKHKKKKSKSKRTREEREETSQPKNKETEAESTPKPIVIETGSGRISTSGTTVQGHEGSKFMTELKAGDAIIVTHPQTNVDESMTHTHCI